MSRIKSLLIVFVVIFSFGCEKEEVVLTCDYMDFKYYQGETDFIGDMSGDYVVMGVKIQNSDEDIAAFVESTNHFDPSYVFNVVSNSSLGYKYITLKLSDTQTCPEISTLIGDIEKNDIVEFVHFAIQTNNCMNLIGESMGTACIDSYSDLFYVKVKDSNDLSDLEATIQETQTVLVEQNEFMNQWFTLQADKNSSGDALQMANYFYETELFLESEPDLIKLVVEE